MGKHTQRTYWIMSLAGILILAVSGCSVPVNFPIQAATEVPSSETAAATATVAQPSATPEPVIPQTADATPTPTAHNDTPTAAPVQPASMKPGVLYQDDFTNPKSGWPESLKFDNYFIGYHEPSFFHVDIHTPNDRAVVALQKQTFTDFTLESNVFIEPSNTAQEGGYRYGLIFRRSGGQYYAFTITPQNQTWQLLKVSPGGTQELKSGSQTTINGRNGTDSLRVDVKETAFYLWINDQLVGQASDIDYGSGEVGFFVETYDSPRVHIHYDTIVVREVELASEQKGLIYQDDFVDPKSGWPESVKFDNYFIGYHEPSFFHVDIHTPNDRAIAALQDQTFTDLTLESKMFTEPNNTAPEGSYRYGLVFRRSGGQFYAFAISPIDKSWQLLKVSPGGTQELLRGVDEGMQGRAGADTLRVDASGDSIYLWINNLLVGRASDASYTSGEVGFFVETFDNPRVHIHYDTITVREAQMPQYSCQVMVQGLNLRDGPTMNNGVITTGRFLERFEPLARSPDGLWLQVRMENQFYIGWISKLDDYFSCSTALEDLPIRVP